MLINYSSKNVFLRLIFKMYLFPLSVQMDQQMLTIVLLCLLHSTGSQVIMGGPMMNGPVPMNGPITMVPINGGPATSMVPVSGVPPNMMPTNGGSQETVMINGIPMRPVGEPQIVAISPQTGLPLFNGNGGFDDGDGNGETDVSGIPMRPVGNSRLVAMVTPLGSSPFNGMDNGNQGRMRNGFRPVRGGSRRNENGDRMRDNDRFQERNGGFEGESNGNGGFDGRNGRFEDEFNGNGGNGGFDGEFDGNGGNGNGGNGDNFNENGGNGNGGNGNGRNGNGRNRDNFNGNGRNGNGGNGNNFNGNGAPSQNDFPGDNVDMIDGRPGLVMVPLSEGLPRSQLPMRRLMIVPRRRLVFLRRPSRRLVFMPPLSMTRRRLPVCKFISLKIDLSSVLIKGIWHIIDET